MCVCVCAKNLNKDTHTRTVCMCRLSAAVRFMYIAGSGTVAFACGTVQWYVEEAEMQI